MTKIEAKNDENLFTPEQREELSQKSAIIGDYWQGFFSQVKEITKPLEDTAKVVGEMIESLSKTFEEIRESYNVDDEEFKVALKFLVSDNGLILPPKWSYKKYTEIYEKFSVLEKEKINMEYAELFVNGIEDVLADIYFLCEHFGYDDGWLNLISTSNDLVNEHGLEEMYAILIYPFYSLLECVLFEKTKHLFDKEKNEKGIYEDKWSAHKAVKRVIDKMNNESGFKSSVIIFYTKILKSISDYFYISFDRYSEDEIKVGRHSLSHGIVSPSSVSAADFHKVLNFINLIMLLELGGQNGGEWHIIGSFV